MTCLQTKNKFLFIELEDHLDLARNKCQVLEKQLEYMRQIMRNNQLPTSPGVVTTSTMSSPLNHVISFCCTINFIVTV